MYNEINSTLSTRMNLNTLCPTFEKKNISHEISDKLSNFITIHRMYEFCIGTHI